MKNKPILFSLFGNEQLANSVSKKLDYSLGEIEVHHFPDEETLVKINTPVQDQCVIFIASLDRPNAKLASLLFAAQTARSLGAKNVSLVAPYLPYMRQDKVFASGEGITSQYFAQFISRNFDSLITIDPHLHRWHALSDIYNIPSLVLHATQAIGDWVKQNVKDPLLIGPDMESAQWLEKIAQQIQAPFLVLEKKRMGDQDVEISIPEVELYRNKTPILIDDIISSAGTMIATVRHIHSLKMHSPICIGIHAIFAGQAYLDLNNSGVEQIITCNTIVHKSNGIDISDLIANALENQTELF